jgi:hypothetical protein
MGTGAERRQGREAMPYRKKEAPRETGGLNLEEEV